MKHRHLNDSMAHEFRLLRNRIEAEVNAPGLIFVASATAGDGANLTAYGLSQSLCNSNQRAVLVTSDASVAPPDVSVLVPQPAPRRRSNDRLEASVYGDGAGRFSVVTISPERLKTISRANVAGMVQELRAQNDYVIVDGSNLSQNSFALLLASQADATLIAFRSGRSEVPEDRSMLETIERYHSKVLGVVLTDERLVREFAARDDLVPASALDENIKTQGSALPPNGVSVGGLRSIGKSI
jgi:Mrp family chromosome partitioning ATPase